VFLLINFYLLNLKNLPDLHHEIFYLFRFKSFFSCFLKSPFPFWSYNLKKKLFLSLFNSIWQVSKNFKITNFQIFIAPIWLILFFTDELNIQYVLKILNDSLKTIHFTYFLIPKFKFIKNECSFFFWKTIQDLEFLF